MHRRIGAALVCFTLVLGLSGARGADAVTGYQKKVAIKAPTRIDWTFVVSNKSLAKPPADWLGDYDSTKQEYDLFVPPSLKPKQPAPLIVFISAGAAPAGWNNFEAVCKEKGILFASPYGAGNNVAPKKRVRIVMDMLDDVRRRHRIDPDRTYIAGFSGGARIACGIVYALPEYFGGAIPVCAVDDLRRGNDDNNEVWLQHRVIDRLSLALITGENDFNRPEVERLHGPVFRDLGVRTRVWTYPKMGHAVPGGKELAEVVAWLDEDVKRRQDLAKTFPASRVDDGGALTREAWSKAVLAEGKERLKDPAGLYKGLMQLQGCMKRWDGLPAAAEAKKILLEYEARKDQPWAKDDVNEQRRLILAQARGLDGYASGPLPAQYEKERVGIAKEALRRWQFIQKDGAGTKNADEAEKRIPALQKIIDGK